VRRLGPLIVAFAAGLVGAAAAIALLGAQGAFDDDDEDAAAGTSAAVVASQPEDLPELASASPPGTEIFDARRLYRDRAAGVVTINAIVEGEAVSGSGFVVSTDGHVVTNAHVITNSPTATGATAVRAAEQVFVRFADGNSVPAKVVGFDLFDDIGIVKVDPADEPLTVLRFGDEGSLTVGDPVAVIGSPFGEDQAQSLSIGVVSALDRTIRPPAVGFETPGVIQTDAAINHGNSGGPVFDARGRVVGVAAQIESTGGGGEGVGFAVPAHLAERSLQEIVASGSVRYAWLGVATTPLTRDLAREFDLASEQGLLVEQVTAGGPAGRAGLRAGERTATYQTEAEPLHPNGDIIVAVDGEPVVEQQDLTRLLGAARPGQKVKLDVLRSGKELELTVTLGERPFNVGR
jgi:S1-C subfamily serine protease